MLPFLIGAAAVQAGLSLFGAKSAANQSARQASAANKAEGDAVVRERLNATIRNSYATSIAQSNLALKKRQLSTQAGEIGAATLAAKGNAELASAATGSIGASVQAVQSDIDQKSQAALDQTTDAFENAVVNYNNDLQMQALNTEQSAPSVRGVQYQGPSGSAMFGTAALGGLASFASMYAMRSMSLGLGSTSATPNISVPSPNSGGGLFV